MSFIYFIICNPNQLKTVDKRMKEREDEKKKLEALLKSARHNMSSVALDTSDLLADSIEAQGSFVDLEPSAATVAPNPPVGALHEPDVCPANHLPANEREREFGANARAGASQLVRRPDRFESIELEFQNSSAGFKRPHSPPTRDEVQQPKKKQKIIPSSMIFRENIFNFFLNAAVSKILSQ